MKFTQVLNTNYCDCEFKHNKFIFQEAMPVKLKQIHLINVSPLTNKFLTLARPFINSEVKEMVRKVMKIWISFQFKTTFS